MVSENSLTSAAEISKFKSTSKFDMGRYDSCYLVKNSQNIANALKKIEQFKRALITKITKKYQTTIESLNNKISMKIKLQKKIEILFSILILTVILQTLQVPKANALTYAAYRTWAQGGARVTSLGGAFAAISDDASSIWISPAMLPIKDSGFDVVFTQGQGFSSEFLPQSTSSGETTTRSSFDAFAATFVVKKKWAVGFGDGNPFFEGPDNPLFGNAQLQVHDTRFSLGSKVAEDVSVAAVFISRFVREKYVGYSTTPTINPQSSLTSEQTDSKIAAGFSIGWKMGEHWSSSVSWEQGQTFSLQNPNGLYAKGNGIQDVRIPTLTRIGLSRAWPEVSVLASLQGDVYSNASGLSAFIDSQYIGQQTNSKDDMVIVPRAGLEHQFLQRNWIRSWVRGGFYIEPPRVEQNRAREHWTLGVESKLWILDFNFAFDHASGYSNAPTSLGISLTDYL